MTQDEAMKNKWIKPLVKRWSKILDLDDWKIHLEEGWIEDDALACVWTTPELKVATIRFKPNLCWKDTRTAVVHEMVHVVHSPYFSMVELAKRSKVEAKMLKKAKESFTCHLHRALLKQFDDRDLRKE